MICAILFSGCASMMKSNFAKKAEAKGISQEDINLVDSQSVVFYGDYQRASAQGNRVNAQQLQTLVSAQMSKITNIYCTCVKKLGDKCQANGSGLAAVEKDMWVKGNGAAEALELIQRSPADPMACPN